MAAKQTSVLIIDDDEYCRAPMAVMLSRSGYHVMQAKDGPEGVELATAQHPDVVLLDLLMPGMNGFQVLRELKARAIPTRVIVMTGRDFVTDIVMAVHEGARDYMVKPAVFTDLDIAIRKVMISEPTLDLETREPGVAKLFDRMKAIENREVEIAKWTERLRAKEKELGKQEYLQQRAILIGRAWGLAVAVGVTLILKWSHVITGEAGAILAPLLFLMLLLPLDKVSKLRLRLPKTEASLDLGEKPPVRKSPATP
jgi:DNA-binding response OmpR family regulator